ncbi:methyltransferase [Bifidobacterium sp. CP2]|uniref:O-methyltransferase n=1 Tax=Bifidobacterium TaxID=1678 RepID=UPI001BDC7473|nr:MULTISPECIES: methyltransferase [Bifidobacterium]MBT1181873.1 methyltransferase [Bifidobacterium sp. CP2]MBW3080115.1 methyltransferase [Bifidobacterium saguinibicoloris]
MDKTQYMNLAKAWEYVEDHAVSRQTPAMASIRQTAERAGLPQSGAAQAEALSMLVRLIGAKSIIAVGTGSVMDTLELVRGLDGSGQLTAVDSSTRGIALIRKAFDVVQDSTATKLRAVSAPVGVFLPRLNGQDYDLIVVSGEASNYAATYEQASRLLRGHGVIVFTDMLAMEGPDAGAGVLDPADRSEKAMAMRELLDTVESDDRFRATLTSMGTGLLIAVKN